MKKLALILCFIGIQHLFSMQIEEEKCETVIKITGTQNNYEASLLNKELEVENTKPYYEFKNQWCPDPYSDERCCCARKECAVAGGAELAVGGLIKGVDWCWTLCTPTIRYYGIEYPTTAQACHDVWCGTQLCRGASDCCGDTTRWSSNGMLAAGICMVIGSLSPCIDRSGWNCRKQVCVKTGGDNEEKHNS